LRSRGGPAIRSKRRFERYNHVRTKSGGLFRGEDSYVYHDSVEGVPAVDLINTGREPASATCGIGRLGRRFDLQINKSTAEIMEDVAGQECLLGEVTVENGELGGTATKPGANARGIV
jgi:hypothetical protein